VRKVRIASLELRSAVHFTTEYLYNTPYVKINAIYIRIKSTQPCIPPGSLNRVPASAGVRAGMSPLSGDR